ncbi:hypothetical protein [Polaribacter cellanae]|uniref:Uncharacterized protein n=1 Tax=Polaribacter cellanae TaxID=2818493 RepID=A0A975CME9_9FLAO|nr:hypothetical protein [Polaribacter cellanae]QTE22009.1 hypothetical protein J3359_14495 [Polaribacter cellanae]
MKLIIYIALSLLASYFFIKTAFILNKDKDLIESYLQKENPFLSDANKLIREFKNNLMWFFFTIFVISLASIFLN